MDRWLIVTAVALGVAIFAGRALYNAWRKPDVACRWCDGKGFISSCSPILNRLVRGRCWFCRGNPWRMRRLSRWLGWDRNSQFSDHY